MAQESERPGVTEMHIRMDCNGCVNRIKKALHSVDGVYEVQVSFPEQKVTVIGRAAPEKMLRAIKKTRKTATICSHTEPGAPDQAAPPAAGAGDPPADAPPAEAASPAEASAAAPPAPEQSTQEPPAPPQEDAAAGEAKPSPEAAAAAAAAAANQAAPEDPPAEEAKDVGEIHTTHDHYRRHHGVYRDHWGDDRAHGSYGSGGQHEAPYLSSVIHSYSRHRPATYVSEYGYLQPPPQSARYAVVEPYGEVDHYRSGRGSDGSNNITSMFSDENPNACTIV